MPIILCVIATAHRFGGFGLNNECIDLIAIDPPFAANETFTGNPRPPISDAEYASAKTLLWPTD